MINKSSAILATNIASILVNERITLTPKTGTLMSSLCTSTYKVLSSTNDYLVKDEIPNMIVSGSTGFEVTKAGVKEYELSEHDSYIDNYIADLIRLSTGYINFAKEVVNKEVTRFTDELTTALSSYRYLSAEELFDVRYFKLHEVFTDDLLINEIADYKDSTRLRKIETLNLKELSTEEVDISKYLLVGDSEVDRYIVSWIDSAGSNILKGYILNSINENSLSTEVLLDYTLANYLFYRNLTNSTNINTGDSLASLLSKSSSNRDTFGVKLCTALELYSKDIRNGRILSSSSDTNFSYHSGKQISIVVYEENFSKLVEAGGSIEVIFGYLSSSNCNTDIRVDNLIENIEGYVTSWNNMRNLYLISINNSRLDTFKSIASITFNSTLTREIEDESEKEYVLSCNGYVDTTKELANKYIDRLKLSDIDYIDSIALDLVAKIRYRYTNAYDLLRSMSELLKLDDKITPDEAALYSIVWYLTDFLLEEVNAVRI